MATPTNEPKLRTRDVPPRTVFALEQSGVHPLLARLFAARGVRSADDLDGFPRDYRKRMIAAYVRKAARRIGGDAWT